MIMTYKNMIDGVEVLTSWTKRFVGNAEDSGLYPMDVDSMLEKAGSVLLKEQNHDLMYNVIDVAKRKSLLVSLDGTGLDIRVTLIAAREGVGKDKRADKVILLKNDTVIVK